MTFCIQRVKRSIAVASLAIVALACSSAALACTTAVVSGRATPDGRPLLWKNRDAPHKNNQVIPIDGGRYRGTAVVNAGSTTSIWMGVNEAGFCIENSVSRDLKEADAQGPGNGAFMRQALQQCASVEEFQTLLEETNGQRGTSANFGVIDAGGGAAIFETSASRFVKFDANDPQTAPDGYVVRSNFSMTGQEPEQVASADQIAQLYSGGRYLRGCQLIDAALSEDGLTATYLLRQCARDLADPQGVPYPGTINGPRGTLPEQLDTTATISRRTSVSAAVFHGVRPDEDPRLTTMWVLLGEPAFTIAVPCWAAGEEVAEELVGEKRSPLCNAARQLRDSCYEEVADAGEEETKRVLRARRLPEIWARTLPVEAEIFHTTAEQLQRWRRDGVDPAEMSELHRTACREALRTLTGLQAEEAGREEEAETDKVAQPEVQQTDVAPTDGPPLEVPEAEEGAPAQKAIQRAIQQALRGEAGEEPPGDPLLEDVLGIIRRQGSVLQGSLLEAVSGSEAPAEWLDRPLPAQEASPDQARRYRTAESLLRTARQLSRLRDDDDADRRRLVQQMRREAARLLQSAQGATEPLEAGR